MMMRYVLTLLLAVGVFDAHAQGDSGAVTARKARVENGLLQPVAVRGAPVHAMRLAERMQALNVPGVSIAVINAGAVEWSGSYGVADARTGRPVTSGTLFQVASIGKPVAALVAVRLAAEGKIDLDEDVNRRLRQWQVPGAQPVVTARALLSHTAGMPTFGLPGYGSDAPQPTLLQVLAGSRPATNPPVTVDTPVGGRYAYSSLGYVVLEQYLNDATGRPFGVLAGETVFAPLGMRDTLYAQSLPPALATRAASGHAADGSVVAGNWRAYPELAAAGLWSTAHDLALFALAVQRAASGQDGQLITQQQARAMLTPVRGSYGLGFELDHAAAEPAFHHSGSNAGYKALLFAYERTGQGAVILANGDNGWMLIEEIARSIAAEYGWEDYRPRERVAAQPNAALLARFAGDFAVSNTTLRVSHENGHLYVAGPPVGPVPVELIPAGDYDYFMREKDATLHFDNSGDGRIQTLTFVDGRPRKGTRLAEAVPRVD